MGITGLLPFVRKASKEVNLKDFRGCTAAVDVYCWLHKGAFSCADKLALGESTNGYIVYCMKYVDLLLANEIKPILVFDGCRLPAKAVTETKRRDNRKKYKEKAREFLREGKYNEAKDCFQRCVDITPEMAKSLLEACKLRNVDCIVAPYEADAQLAFFSHKDIAELIISEDSDLLLFGAKKVLFKMDLAGRGILVEREKLNLCMNPRTFTFDKFLCTCILSGCDYLPSLPGIGLGRAQKFFDKTANPDIYTALLKLPSYLNMPNLTVTDEYRKKFMEAYYTFQHQIVFNPFALKMEPLYEYPSDLRDLDLSFAGKWLDKETALGIAKGDLNVATLQKWPRGSFDLKLRYSTTNHSSIWDANFTPHRKHQVEEPQQRVSTHNKAMIISVPKFIKDMQKAKPRKDHDHSPNENNYKEEAALDLDIEEYFTEPPTKKQKVSLVESVSPVTSVMDCDNSLLTSLNGCADESPGSSKSLPSNNFDSVNPFARSNNRFSTSHPEIKFSALQKFSNLKKNVVEEAECSRYFASEAVLGTSRNDGDHSLGASSSQSPPNTKTLKTAVTLTQNLFQWKSPLSGQASQTNNCHSQDRDSGDFTCIASHSEFGQMTEVSLDQSFGKDNLGHEHVSKADEKNSSYQKIQLTGPPKGNGHKEKKQLSLKELFSFSKKCINVFPRT